MIELSVALVFLGLLAWDIARRAVKPAPLKRLEQAETNLQEVAADLGQTDLAMKGLAEDWRAKFKQLEDAQKEFETKLTTKLGGTIASLPSKGYNR
jgi:hypothetical protein